MQVRQGWSGEVASNVWVKISVDLDENDLRRVVVEEAGLSPDLTAQVPITLAYRLLDAEADRLIQAKLVAAYGFPVDVGKTRLAESGSRKASALAELRARFANMAADDVLPFRDSRS